MDSTRRRMAAEQLIVVGDVLRTAAASGRLIGDSYGDAVTAAIAEYDQATRVERNGRRA